MTAILVQTDRPAAEHGSGRRTCTRWFRVVTAHVANGQTIIDGINVEVASGGHYAGVSRPLARPIAA